PSAGVPLPGGRLPPSGRMLMSHAAISAVLKCLPRFGPSAYALAAPSNSATAALKKLRVNMAHLPVCSDRPARDAVVVLIRKREDRRRRGQLAALRDEF